MYNREYTSERITELKPNEIRLSLLISEMEETINQIIPCANFKYPMEDFLGYDEIVGIIGWEFPKGRDFIQEQLDYMKEINIYNLVPFAMNGNHGKEEPSKYACFLIDGINNSKVVTVCPFSSANNFYQEEYGDINEWFHTEMVASRLKAVMTLHGKPKCLGLDMIDGAHGPLVAIPKQLLKGHRLVMTTDAGVWYAENDKIKNTVEKYGCGLHVVSVSELDNHHIEAIMEVTEVDAPNPICVEGVTVNLPNDAYILATPFAGEFFVKLESEDANGNREFLWIDDYIYK